MPARYDLLVIDLDGTLLGPDGEVSRGNREAVQRARDAGLTVIVATGRARVESLHLLEHIDYEGLVITAGGAILSDAHTGRTIMRRALAPDVVETVVAALVDDGHRGLVLKDADAAGFDYLAVGGADLDPASAWWFRTMPIDVRRVSAVGDDPHPEHSLRAGAVARADRLSALAEDLRAALGDRAVLQHWSAVTESKRTGASTHLLEVFGPRVNKWTMIEDYCARHDVDPARVAAIGDELNDVEMLAEAGLGIAMGNATAAARRVADRVTRGHDEDGVAHAIEHVVAGRW